MHATGSTSMVRSVLVPALIALLGRRFWWPWPLSQRAPSDPR